MSELHELSHGEMVARIKAAEQERNQLHIALRDEVYDRLAAEARVEAAEKVFRQISDPSYVGNYAPLEVIEIYRKWAALACPPQQRGEQ